ncbi:MAG: hypothetical protein JXB23_05705 [Candidatus Aminicenantes bacterium]|nr:hypothetical protein [Candidatus Aminicenantes bacterium]
MRKLLPILVAAGCLLCFTADARAAKIKISDTAFLDIHGYMQHWLHMPLDQGPSIKTDFYLRRVRLLFTGQIAPNVNFFIGTLNSDMGKNGDMSSRTLIADAWMEFVISDYLTINAGLLKLPFSRHMQQTGGKLHGLDFHGSYLMRYGGIGHRDMGIMARGLLLNNKIDYRIAILDGKEYAPGNSNATPPVADTNKNDSLRLVGRAAYNVFDSEPGYFWAGTYLGTKKILSFGLSFDIQSGVGGENGNDLYSAIAVDAFADIPIGKNGIVSTLNFYSFGAGGAVPEGHGLWADFGYRIDKIEPLIAFEWYSPSQGDAGKRQAILAGLNWWIHGHNVNIKFQFGTENLNGVDKWTNTAIVQGQLLF